MKEGNAGYDVKMAVYVKLKLNRKTDADLIAALESASDKQALIKEALRTYAIPDSWTGEWPATPNCPACGGEIDDEIVYMLDGHTLPKYCPYCGKNLSGRSSKMIDMEYYAQAVELMDDEIREEMHRERDWDSEEEFLREYEKRHLAKYGEAFTV